MAKKNPTPAGVTTSTHLKAFYAALRKLPNWQRDASVSHHRGACAECMSRNLPGYNYAPIPHTCERAVLAA